jgi:hypothetical protein
MIADPDLLIIKLNFMGTNSGRTLRFEGMIRGNTKNYWKVESITSPYEGEKPGRIFHIATIAKPYR